MRSFESMSRALFATVLLAAWIAADAETTSDEQEIRDVYAAWTRTTDARDIEAWSRYLAADPHFVAPGVAPLATRESILDYYSTSFADPNFSLDCEHQDVNVGPSGAMAWSRGICNATYSDRDGRIAEGLSRWFKVWVKQTDGSWKCKVNTWNYEDN